MARKGVCAACALRSQCTTSKHSRMVSRYREHEPVLRGRAQATSSEAWRDYRCFAARIRQTIMLAPYNSFYRC